MVDWSVRGARGHDRSLACAHMSSMVHGGARTRHKLVAITCQLLMTIFVPDFAFSDFP